MTQVQFDISKALMARFVLVSLELNPRSEFPLIAFNRKLKPSWAEWSSCFLQASPKFRGMTWKIALTWFMYICVCPTAEREQSAESELLVFSLVSGSPYYDNVRPLSYPDSDAVLICFDISRPETLDSVLKKVCHIFFPFFFLCHFYSKGNHPAFDKPFNSKHSPPLI